MSENINIQPGQYNQTSLRNQSAERSVPAQDELVRSSGVTGSETVRAMIKEPVLTDPVVASESKPSIDTDPKMFEQTMEGLNQTLQQTKSALQFAMHKEYGKMVIKVKDESSGEVIRQIPSDQFLAMAENITQFLERSRSLPGEASPLTGLFANEQA
ncbi:flagellar protein FlaG [Thiomicrospira sp. WB1]|uniref:flagellar protein FlaG n=1 Tax=Thiomicrospira sp. WB1 TaxID=1685380 RepID=UPI00074A98BC|nr:flagellar protein FlaG [Thiomicrospira sp. WB1]KUJ71633.1 hypothetical protein AVO41_08965 [Thiomicrospira sp. WB1]